MNADENQQGAKEDANHPLVPCTRRPNRVRLLIGDRKNHLADRLIRVFQARISNTIQDARFPGHAFEIIEIRGLDTTFGPRPDAMHDLDEQGDQGVGDFLRALKHEGRQQRQANGMRVFANMRRRFGGDASSQSFNELGCISFASLVLVG